MKFTQNEWGQRDILNIIIKMTKRGANQILNWFEKMIEFTQNDCGQCDIINRITILTKYVQIRYMMSFRRNIRNIPLTQDLTW